MALEGSLKEFGLADILQLIYFQRKTGVLTLEGRMDRIRLLFYEGNIIAAESKRRTDTDRIGKILAKKGIIKDEDLKKALELQQTTGEKVGNILIKNGLVTKEQIQELIISQITETVVQLFSWKDGMYEFNPQGVPIDKDIPITVDTQHLLMEGLRIMDDWSAIEEKLTLDTIFEKTTDYDARITPEEKEILEYVDGERDVSTIIEDSQIENYQASKMLVSLLEKKVIKQKEAAVASPIIAALPELETVKAKKKRPVITTLSIIIVFLLSFFVSFCVLLLQKNYDLDRAKTSEDIDKIRFLIEAYKYETGAYPSSISQVTGKIIDRWGSPYIYKVGNNDFVLYSMGPDGIVGTEDDIH